MRKSRSLRDPKMHIKANSPPDASAIAASLASALRRAYGDFSAPIKRWSRAAGVHPRSGRNHYEGRNCPRAPELIRGMAECDELLLEVLRLSGRLTPETVEQLIDAITAPESAPDVQPQQRRGGPSCGH
ncbi:MAG: hypothetical protein ACU0A2_15320 [Cognatishimia sp.]|uniref:hypothetical protein n=1 Tax=Cognatishimia sp. TaxID=2211648 RepID=UPI004058512E